MFAFSSGSMAEKSSNTIESPKKVSIVEQLFSWKTLVCICFGFSSGLPLYLLINLVSAWLRSDSSIDLKSIGLLSLCLTPYSWKFVWAPIVDRYDVLKLGRRRSWILLTQVALFILIAVTGFCSPGIDLFKIGYGDVSFGLNSFHIIVVIYFLICLFSATQDIAIDAYRREILDDNELGWGNSVFVNAYRISGMVPGGLSLILSEYMPWSMVFCITALFMLVGIITTLYISEPECTSTVPRTLYASIVEPFKDFIKRHSWGGFIAVISFIFLYKLGDTMATALATPFYIDMGYSPKDIGVINKGIGLWTMIIGGTIGGIIMLKIGINKALWIFGVGQIITILGYLFIAYVWQNQDSYTEFLSMIDDRLGTEMAASFKFPNWNMLALVVGGESMGAGLGTACFVAFICRETKGAYVATQFALLTALSAVPRSFFSASTGFIIESLGYVPFFAICYAMAIPGMLMLIYVAPYNGDGSKKD